MRGSFLTHHAHPFSSLLLDHTLPSSEIDPGTYRKDHRLQQALWSPSQVTHLLQPQGCHLSQAGIFILLQCVWSPWLSYPVSPKNVTPFTQTVDG